MEDKEQEIAERLEAATIQLEQTLSWLAERQGALSGEVEKISATVEQGRRETQLAEKLAAAEQELAELKAGSAQNVLSPLRRTLPSTTSEMLAKQGIGEGPVDVTDSGCRTGWPKPGTAHRSQDSTAASWRDCVMNCYLLLATSF